MKAKTIAVAIAFLGGTALAGPASAQMLDSEKPGSVVIYPLFDVSGTKKTTIRISNTHPNIGPAEDKNVDVHLVQVCGGEVTTGTTGFCTAGDRERTLTPGQTRILNVANVWGPAACANRRGYILAYAENELGEPVSFNFLIGSTYIRDSGSGKLRAEGAQAVTVQALKDQGEVVGEAGIFPKLFFDGVNLASLPGVLFSDFRSSQGSGLTKKGSRVALATLNIQAGAQNPRTLIAVNAWAQNEEGFSGSFEYVCHVLAGLEEGNNPPGPNGFEGGGFLQKGTLGSNFGLVQFFAGDGHAIVGQMQEFENNRSTLRNLFHDDTERTATFLAR